jgi:hypothetical protein
MKRVQFNKVADHTCGHHFFLPPMAPIYNNSFRDDIDIINCINSLRRDSQPNPPPNNSNIPPHSNPLHYKDREVIEIFSSDEEEQPETARSKEVRPNRPSSVSSDDYPNDATHWVEYNVRDRRQARAKEMRSDEEEQPETTRSKEDRPNRASSGSPDEYPDPEIDRLIAMVDLQTLDGPSHGEYESIKFNAANRLATQLAPQLPQSRPITSLLVGRQVLLSHGKLSYNLNL